MKFVAFLRAINVGGTGKLSMADLVKLCEKAGFGEVKTYIQSGNVVFSSKLAEAKVKATLEAALVKKMGKPVGVVVRSNEELVKLLKKPPFAEMPPNRVIVFFMDEAPAKSVLDGVVSPTGEELKLVGRELFVYYPEGQGVSKLKVPVAKVATGRNLNTVRKLEEMSR